MKPLALGWNVPSQEKAIRTQIPLPFYEVTEEQASVGKLNHQAVTVHSSEDKLTNCLLTSLFIGI